MEENLTVKTMCTFDLNYSCWRTFATKENDIYSSQMTPVISMMVVFQTVGIPGNLFVLLMYFTRTQRTTANVFIMFLAGIDLFACVVIHPYIVYKLYNFYDQTWTVACKLFEFLIHVNLAMSALTLLLVAIDRYLAICRPVKFLLFDRNIVKGIVSVTVMSLVISLPLLEFYGPNPHPYEFEEGIFLSYRCDFQPVYQGSMFYMAFSAFMVTGFLVEIVVLSVLYKQVAVVAYKSHRTVLPVSHPRHIHAGNKSTHPVTSDPGPSNDTINSTKSGTITGSTGTSHGSPTRLPQPLVPANIRNHTNKSQVEIFTIQPTTSKVKNVPIGKSRKEWQKRGHHLRSTGQLGNVHINHNRLKNKLKAAKLLFLVTFVFFLSWVPFFVLRVCYTLDKGACLMQSYTGRIVDNMLNHVFYINNAINPILYTILNKSFRAEFADMVKRRFFT